MAAKISPYTGRPYKKVYRVIGLVHGGMLGSPIAWQHVGGNRWHTHAEAKAIKAQLIRDGWKPKQLKIEFALWS